MTTWGRRKRSCWEVAISRTCPSTRRSTSSELWSRCLQWLHQINLWNKLSWRISPHHDWFTTLTWRPCLEVQYAIHAGHGLGEPKEGQGPQTVDTWDVELSREPVLVHPADVTVQREACETRLETVLEAWKLRFNNDIWCLLIVLEL